MTSGRLREVKNKRNLQTVISNVVAVAYERWSLTTGSKNCALTGNILVCGNVNAQERWSQGEVPLYVYRTLANNMM